MRVVVDFDRCDSTGLCAETAPEVFELGEDDVLHVRAEYPPPQHWPVAELAERSCPKLAITLQDTDALDTDAQDTDREGR
jgi:ferredoxin